MIINPAATLVDFAARVPLTDEDIENEIAIFAARDAEWDESHRLAEGFAVDDRDNAAGSPDSFEAHIAAALAEVKTALGLANARKRAPLFCDARDLFTRTFAKAMWLITGLITAGGVAIFGAEPKACKTWLATELAVAVATGTKALGEYFAMQGRVAYFYAEDLDRQVRNRIGACLKGRGLTYEALGDRLFAQPRGKFLDLLDDEDLAWIIASCRKIGKLDLLVIDPLRDVHGGEEDKSDSMRNVMRRLRLLGELLGCTVAIAHHAAKSSKDTAGRRGGQKLRGSGAIHGAVDSAIYLSTPTGDGVGHFRMTAESEVKGAASAGSLCIELEVEDIDKEAVCARWRVSKPVPNSGATVGNTTDVDADADAIVGVIRDQALKAKHLTKTRLRDLMAPSLPRRRFDPAFAYVESEDRIVQRKAVDASGEEIGRELVFLADPPADRYDA